MIVSKLGTVTYFQKMPKNYFYFKLGKMSSSIRGCEKVQMEAFALCHYVARLTSESSSEAILETYSEIVRPVHSC